MRSLAILTLLFAFAARGEDTRTGDRWDLFWQDCRNFQLVGFQSRLSQFKEFLQQGQTWQAAVNLEKIQIDQVTNETCKRWAEDPNGDAALREFLAKFSQVANQALAAKQKVDGFLEPQMQNWSNLQRAELRRFRLPLESYGCGQAFVATRAHIAAELKIIEGKFELLRDRCPKAADAVIAEALAKGTTRTKASSVGQGMGKVVPKVSGKANNGVSDITRRGNWPVKAEPKK